MAFLDASIASLSGYEVGSGESEGWFEFSAVMGGIALGLVLSVVAQRLNNVGTRHTRTLRPSNPFASLYVSVNFALMPFAWSLVCALIVGIAHGLEIATGATVFQLVLLVAGAGMIGCFGWAYKEFIRPSKWRKVPEWMYEQGLMERPKGD